ncbi:proton-coupled folate transporter-like isoform X2 [Acanthaster planci]|uniref:Proton-coupled folate transporter-like isoform X2 n=1 Tax=Acanthaster planci TaxID=133434 RepID=A0A8B7YXE2_ACAPL|nr:proton-coupled folate transporter-like isoform X2 [Acanthaster planci]
MTFWYLNLVTVEPVLFLFTMSLFMQYPVTQLLVLHKVCLSIHNSTAVCANISEDADEENEVQSTAAHWNLYLTIAINLPGALMSVIYGAISDQVGRRGVMVLPSVGLILGSVGFFLQSHFIHAHVAYLLPSALIIGVFGNVGASYIALMSHICDITEVSSRTKRLGIMESMSFIGGPIGMMAAGAMVQHHGFEVVYLLIIALNSVIVLYIALRLEEPSKRSVKSDKKLRSISHVWLRRMCRHVSSSLLRTLRVYFIKREDKRRRYLLIIQLIGILGIVAFAGELDLFILYTKHSPLTWSASTIGIYLSVRTLLKGVPLAIGLPILFGYFRHRSVRFDLVLAMLGLVSVAASMILVAFSHSMFMMALVAGIGCLSGYPGAIMGSIKSKLVQPDEFGALFACTVLIQTAFVAAGSLLFNTLYSATLRVWPGLSFIGIGAIYMVNLVLVIYLWLDMADVKLNENHTPADREFAVKLLSETEDSEMDDAVV